VKRKILQYIILLSVTLVAAISHFIVKEFANISATKAEYVADCGQLSMEDFEECNYVIFNTPCVGGPTSGNFVPEPNFSIFSQQAKMRRRPAPRFRNGSFAFVKNGSMSRILRNNDVTLQNLHFPSTYYSFDKYLFNLCLLRL